MGIEAEEKFFGQGGGVSTCATCDGHSYRGKTVAVVGGGDSAMEEASYLANLGITVHLIHRRDEFRSSRIMLDRVRKNPNITIHEFRQIVDLLGKPHPMAQTSKFFADKEVVRAARLGRPARWLDRRTRIGRRVRRGLGTRPTLQFSPTN